MDHSFEGFHYTYKAIVPHVTGKHKLFLVREKRTRTHRKPGKHRRRREVVKKKKLSNSRLKFKMKRPSTDRVLETLFNSIRDTQKEKDKISIPLEETEEESVEQPADQPTEESTALPDPRLPDPPLGPQPTGQGPVRIGIPVQIGGTQVADPTEVLDEKQKAPLTPEQEAFMKLLMNHALPTVTTEETFLSAREEPVTQTGSDAMSFLKDGYSLMEENIKNGTESKIVGDLMDYVTSQWKNRASEVEATFQDFETLENSSIPNFEGMLEEVASDPSPSAVRTFIEDTMNFLATIPTKELFITFAFGAIVAVVSVIVMYAGLAIIITLGTAALQFASSFGLYVLGGIIALNAWTHRQVHDIQYRMNRLGQGVKVAMGGAANFLSNLPRNVEAIWQSVLAEMNEIPDFFTRVSFYVTALTRAYFSNLRDRAYQSLQNMATAAKTTLMNFVIIPFTGLVRSGIHMLVSLMKLTGALTIGWNALLIGAHVGLSQLLAEISNRSSEELLRDLLALEQTPISGSVSQSLAEAEDEARQIVQATNGIQIGKTPIADLSGDDVDTTVEHPVDLSDPRIANDPESVSRDDNLPNPVAAPPPDPSVGMDTFHEYMRSTGASPTTRAQRVERIQQKLKVPKRRFKFEYRAARALFHQNLDGFYSNQGYTDFETYWMDFPEMIPEIGGRELEERYTQWGRSFNELGSTYIDEQGNIFSQPPSKTYEFYITRFKKPWDFEPLKQASSVVLFDSFNVQPSRSTLAALTGRVVSSFGKRALEVLDFKRPEWEDLRDLVRWASEFAKELLGVVLRQLAIHAIHVLVKAGLTAALSSFIGPGAAVKVASGVSGGLELLFHYVFAQMFNLQLLKQVAAASIDYTPSKVPGDVNAPMDWFSNPTHATEQWALNKIPAVRYNAHPLQGAAAADVDDFMDDPPDIGAGSSAGTVMSMLMVYYLFGANAAIMSFFALEYQKVRQNSPDTGHGVVAADPSVDVTTPGFTEGVMEDLAQNKNPVAWGNEGFDQFQEGGFVVPPMSSGLPRGWEERPTFMDEQEPDTDYGTGGYDGAGRVVHGLKGGSHRRVHDHVRDQQVRHFLVHGLYGPPGHVRHGKHIQNADFVEAARPAHRGYILDGKHVPFEQVATSKQDIYNHNHQSFGSDRLKYDQLTPEHVNRAVFNFYQPDEFPKLDDEEEFLQHLVYQAHDLLQTGHRHTAFLKRVLRELHDTSPRVLPDIHKFGDAIHVQLPALMARYRTTQPTMSFAEVVLRIHEWDAPSFTRIDYQDRHGVDVGSMHLEPKTVESRGKRNRSREPDPENLADAMHVAAAQLLNSVLL